MSIVPFIVVSAALAVALRVVWVKLRGARRADFIRSFAFPKGLIEKLQRRRPELAAKDGFGAVDGGGGGHGNGDGGGDAGGDGGGCGGGCGGD